MSPYSNTSPPSYVDPVNTPSLAPSSVIPVNIDNQIPDLRLLHHYTTVTVQTLTSDPRAQEGWRLYMVKIAFEHPFLLHGILSLAALHLSRIDQAKTSEYLAQAVQNHDSALDRFRTDVQDVDLSNFQAVLCYSTITFPYYYGLPVDERSGPEYIWNMEIQHLSLIRGIRPIIGPFWETMCDSELGQLMPKDVVGLDFERTMEKTELVHLRQFPEITANLHSQEITDSYRESIRTLEVVFSIFPLGPTMASFSALKLWPHQISSQFMDLLTQRQPGALVIFAHYAVLLARSERYWFMEGTSDRILRTVEALLDDKWKTWLDWPKAELRRCNNYAGA
ncbi:hypothetical protein GQ43DRAFT_383013 [Delitschia confertaspora ATCC 74209]|uniref:Uncharacterized protein n=1 Tax=Delitschia confertaspora ATCC 74209 TaxID=1513339 RepID=A0A9P4MTX6_9PLEO|nr:hypothetical protein GQ43DRAFT_383013 [Delitschia confertaspora ATCC 74209]